MSWPLWLAFVATALVVMLVPGPSHLLMLSNSLSHGFGRALATAAGDLSANVLQMLAAGLGLAAIVTASPGLFTWIQWGGVFYLLWLGWQMLRRVPAADGRAAATSRARLWWQGFFTSASNPKAIVFFAALFPQFIDPGDALPMQLAVLMATYLVVDGAFLALYGGGAAWLASRLRAGAGRALQRIGAVALLLAALLLGLRIVAS